MYYTQVYKEIIEKFYNLTIPPYSLNFGRQTNLRGFIPGKLTKDELIKKLFNKSFIQRPSLVTSKVLHQKTTSSFPLKENTFSIASWNMYNGKCDNKLEIMDMIPYTDVILTQENDKTVFKINQYECGQGSESVGIYTHKDLHIDECIHSSIFLEETKNRYGLISIVNGIKIANLHLEGGRFTDKLIFKIDKRQLLLKFKLDLLEKIIYKNPHCIAGDFNSVYEHEIEKQFSYFSLKKIEK